jgi:restriction system protein
MSVFSQVESLAGETNKAKLFLSIIVFGVVAFISVYVATQFPSWEKSVSVVGGLSGICVLVSVGKLAFLIAKDAIAAISNPPVYCWKCHTRVDSRGSLCARCTAAAKAQTEREAEARVRREEQEREAERQEEARKRKVRTLEGLQQLSGKEFEDLIASLFRKDGYTVRQCGGSGDQGIDLILYITNTEKDVVQCKRWKSDVGSPVVREFYGAMMHSNARHGFIITTAVFSSSARRFVTGKPITLISGQDIIRWIDNAFSAWSSAESSARQRARHGNSSRADNSSFDPYTVLGIKRGASREEIRAAYRREMSKYHPDKVAGLGTELQELANLKAQAINRAYSELSLN